MKIKKVVLILLLIIALLVAGSLFYHNFFKIGNVFDQMYYTRIRTTYNWFGGNRVTLFQNMEQLKNIPRDMELYCTEEGFFFENYKEEYLEENQSISFDFSKARLTIAFTFAYRFPDTDERISLVYTYYLENRELIKRPIRIVGDQYTNSFSENKDDIDDFLSRHDLTWEEIEELHNWFLYDKILVDWFEANDAKSRFSLNNLGRFTLVDETVGE